MPLFSTKNRDRLEAQAGVPISRSLNSPRKTSEQKQSLGAKVESARADKFVTEVQQARPANLETSQSTEFVRPPRIAPILTRRTSNRPLSPQLTVDHLPDDVLRIIIDHTDSVRDVISLRQVNKHFASLLPLAALDAQPNSASLACVRDWVERVPMPGCERPPMPERVLWTLSRVRDLSMRGWLDAVPFDPKKKSHDAAKEIFRHMPCVRAIYLNPNHATSAEIAGLVASLPPSVNTLLLGNRRGCDEKLRFDSVMTRALSSRPNLTKLHISYTEISDDDLGRMTRSIGGFLEEVWFRGCGISNRGGEMKMANFSRIRIMNLSHNSLDDIGAHHLLTGGSQTLKLLDLSSNTIRSLIGSDLSSGRYEALRVLRLDYNPLSPRDLRELPLNTLPALKSLSLRGISVENVLEQMPLVDVPLKMLQLGKDNEWGHALRYAPLLYMNNLETLVLEGRFKLHQVAESPLFYLPSLRTIYFTSYQGTNQLHNVVHEARHRPDTSGLRELLFAEGLALRELTGGDPGSGSAISFRKGTAKDLDDMHYLDDEGYRFEKCSLSMPKIL